MIPNFSKPFSAFTCGDNNPASFIIGQHYENVEGAINYLVGLYNDDVDINDEEVLQSVLHKYSLDEDGFESEIEYIVQEVNKRLR